MATYIASHLKDMNRLTAYNLIREHEEISRTEISRITGISSPTVLKIMEFLTRNGLVTEIGAGHASIGRKPQMFTCNKNRYYSVSVIHEGDCIRAGVVNLNSEITAFRRVRARKPLGEVLGEVLFRVIDELLAESGVETEQLLGIGIGLPGIYDPDEQAISTAPLIGVPGRMLIQEYIAAIEQRYTLNVIVENDLNMEVQGEYHVLKLGPKSDLVYISLGTGMGGGVILGGELRRGMNNMCGEIGYMSFLSDYAADVNKVGWLENKINIDMLREKFGISQGDPIPPETLKAAVEYVSEYVALCVNNIVMCYDCGNISLGGEVFDLLGDTLFESIRGKVRTLSVAKVSLHKKTCREPGITGAALMVSKKYIERALCDA